MYICRTISVQNKDFSNQHQEFLTTKDLILLICHTLSIHIQLVVPFAVLQKVNQIPSFLNASSNFTVSFLKPVGHYSLAEAVSRYTSPPVIMDDLTAHHHIIFIPLWTEAFSWTLYCGCFQHFMD